MFQNYLRIAFRNLTKRKGFTFINIFGLAVGIACCLLISLYVYYELSYDRFHENSDRIYRLVQTSVSPTREEAGASTPFKAGPTLREEYPDLIQQTVRLFDMQEDVRTILNRENKRAFRVDHFYFSDSGFFEIFDADLIIGNPEEVLNEPQTVVISEKWAELFFPGENPVGKSLIFKGVTELTVTGIMHDMPKNSHMKIEMLASMSTLDTYYGGRAYDISWFWNPCWTYLLLAEKESVDRLMQQLPGFSDKYYNPNNSGQERVDLDLQPITDIHLYSSLDQELQPNNSIFYIYLFSATAFLILLIACINFMNLSTARSAERNREIGMRKVLGADRRQLFFQFMGESLLMVLLALVTAVIMAQLALPWFNEFVDRQLGFGIINTKSMLGSILGFILVTGFISGIYPAIYLSGFNPVSIFQGGKSGGWDSGTSFRKGLVVFQFALSVILIIGTVIIYEQLQHMQNKKLGFDKEQIVIMPVKQNLISWEFDRFRELALNIPGITSVVGTSKVLGSDRQVYYNYAPIGKYQSEKSTNMGLHVTYGFFETYNIPLLAGRSFSREYPTDPERALIINEKMLDFLEADTPGEALGSLFAMEQSDGKRQQFEVIGVTDNFNYTSVKKEIEPVFIRLVDDTRSILARIQHVSVKIQPGRLSETLEQLESVWNEVNPVDPFTYSFHDEELDKIYESEVTMGRVSGIFAGLCILVACLGLFGLASFTATKRTKEIGIRKTLGASVAAIVTMLSKEYLKLVLIANVISWPVVYYLSVQWLQNFPNRFSLGWNLVWICLIAAATSLLICLITVSWQSVKAAMVNPVESIRRE